MNRTLLELELNCPAGTSGTAVTPGVTEWSPTLQQLFIKADRLGGDGWGSIYGKWRWGHELKCCTVQKASSLSSCSSLSGLYICTYLVLSILTYVLNCKFYKSSVQMH